MTSVPWETDERLMNATQTYFRSISKLMSWLLSDSLLVFHYKILSFPLKETEDGRSMQTMDMRKWKWKGILKAFLWYSRDNIVNSLRYAVCSSPVQILLFVNKSILKANCIFHSISLQFVHSLHSAPIRYWTEHIPSNVFLAVLKY